MSSRSLGLLAGFFVSQGRSHPASCFLMRSGSSVRKRMRPWRRTLSGRFRISRSRSELLTLARCERALTTGVTGETLPHVLISIVLLGDSLLRVLYGAWQLFQAAAGEDFMKFVQQCFVHKAV